ncbi:DUF1120 domain-containing protein [Burkholderia cenocepacia]|uniref:DUF1120 domain-containing protein n=1 Tax=Burkholderia cenocepacia TaxID=95486 RepID=UPI00285F5C60|nr:DUF1120 domain-containing protein [Burkholderia cenocepacia]MDR8047989.1 DUF1120 domain-containing protein [Burkholderia cenocepacia]
MKSSVKSIHVAMVMCMSALALDAQAQSLSIEVTGEIEPPACTVSLGGGGVFEYGDISSRDLSNTENTELTSKTQNLTISCKAPTSVALKAIDNQSDTAINPSHPNSYARFGLGKVGDTRIGFFNISLKDSEMDGAAVHHYLHSTDQGGTWTPGQGIGYSEQGFVRNDGWLSFADTVANTPATFAKFESSLTVSPVIARANDLPRSDDFEISGSVTLELEYL